MKRVVILRERRAELLVERQSGAPEGSIIRVSEAGLVHFGRLVLRTRDPSDAA